MTAPFRIDLADGALIGERQGGSGNPLVLVHGFGGSRRDWQPLLSALPADLPRITYDLRGFGESTGEPGAPFSHSDDLLCLMDLLEIEQADICGMSLGGATALNFALNHPHRLHRLVLISPLIVGWSWTSEWVDLWKQIGRAARGGDMDAARALWWQHPLFAMTRGGPAADVLQAAIAGYHGQQWIQDDQRPEMPDIDRLTGLATPTLLLTGGRDMADFVLIADVIASAGQQVTRIDYPEAGHLLNLDIAGPIADEISAFLIAER